MSEHDGNQDDAARRSEGVRLDKDCQPREQRSGRPNQARGVSLVKKDQATASAAGHDSSAGLWAASFQVTAPGLSYERQPTGQPVEPPAAGVLPSTSAAGGWATTMSSRGPEPSRWHRGWIAVLAIAAVSVLVLAAVLAARVAGLKSQTGQRAGASASPPAITSAVPGPTTLSSSPAAPTPSTPAATPKPVSPMVSYRIRREAGPTPGDCVGDSFGQVRQFLESQSACSLNRALYSGMVGGRPIALSVVTVALANPSDGQSLVELSSRNGTGDIRTLIYDGQGYPGSPDAWTADPTFLAVIDDHDQVKILEVMWADGQPTHERTPALATMLGAVAPDV